MNDITRKDFLKTVGLAFAGLVCSSSPADFGGINVNNYKDDPIGFIEKYFVRWTGERIILKDYQKEYIRKLNANEFFVCNKCRQAGVTTMNIAFAYWKTTCFENTQVVVVEPKRMTQFEVEDIIRPNAPEKNIFAKGSSIIFMSANRFDETIVDRTKHTIVILDEAAFYGNSFKHSVEDLLSAKFDQIALVSTPCKCDGVFFNSITLARHMASSCNLDCYMQISGEQVFSKEKMH